MNDIVNSLTNKGELDLYLSEGVVDSRKDPLVYWRENAQKYRSIAKLIFKYLCPNSSAVDTERIGSVETNLISKKRASLLSGNVEEVVVCRKYLINDTVCLPSI
jgi:hypothetical protein